MADRRVGLLRHAALVSSIACIPMLSVLVSNPQLSDFGAAAATSLEFVGALFVVNLLALAGCVASKGSGVKWIAGTLLAVELAFAMPGFLRFALEQTRQGLIASGVLPGYRTLAEGMFLAVIAAFAVWFVRSRGRAVTSVVSTFGGLLALLFAVLCVQAVLGGMREHGDYQQTAAPHADRRVVWVVMDELDEDVLESRLTSLPAFNDLWLHSVVGTQTFSPANFTHQSVPRMLVGRELLSAEMTQTRVSLRDRADVPSHSLARDPDFIIRKLAREGRSVAVAGWDLPYCAIVPNIVACVDDARTEVPGAGVTPVHWLWSQSPYVAWWTQWRLDHDRRPLQEVLLSIFREPRLLKVNANSATFSSLSAATLSQIDARFDVVFAHWPCPHLPRMDGVVDSGTSALMNSYLANISMCDTQLAAVTEHIRRAQATDLRPVTLIVTSDHWLRARDCIDQGRLHCLAPRRRRVPLLIRNFDVHTTENAMRPYARIINNLELPRMVMEISNGKPAAQQDVVNMLDTFKDHPTIIEPF